jgi:hypothetical protein
MTGLRIFARKWKSLANLIAKCFAIGVLANAVSPEVLATGYSGPRQFLDDGGKKVDGSPQFYWELEVKRLAKDFKPTEKRVTGKPAKKAESEDAGETPAPHDNFTAETDTKDFALALKGGRIKPGDPAKATQQHEAARKFIMEAIKNGAAPAPEEFASEFADYHRGALAYRLGKEHWQEARAAWEGLLKRPAAERHFRTVWATFMLGKVALKSGDPEAVNWFRKTRELAKEGFADSLGMAADSYGWEGRSEWKQGHLDKAARLFLTQLALGDESAVVSLKAVLPDRESVEGMLNYGPEYEETSNWTDEQKKASEEKTRAVLRAAVNDPLLRRLETAHILATEAGVVPFEGGSESVHVNRCARWLAAIKEARLDKVEDAEYIGWVAYANGDYKGAAHWLELAGHVTPASCWLRAKLQKRAGKLQDALTSMAQAWQGIRGLTSYTAWKEQPESRDEDNDYTYRRTGDDWSFEQFASGDLGSLHLVRADFVEAMDTFLKGGLWTDAAYVAERVLTADELKKYVDQQPPSSAEKKEGGIYPKHLRDLLGRRLVREDRYEEAAAYLQPPYEKILKSYAGRLKYAADPKMPKEARAEAWFTAAWLARHEGMELMGTEVAPDVADTDGEFTITDLARQRLTGKIETTEYEGEQEKTVATPISLKASKQELQRLAKNKIVPDLRFHYRVIAAALALKAAALLPDNSEELADVVNTAGGWVKDRDNKLADSYYLVLLKRCPKTEIGRAAKEKRWFVDQGGPWTAKQAEERALLRKSVGLDKSE